MSGKPSFWILSGHPDILQQQTNITLKLSGPILHALQCLSHGVILLLQVVATETTLRLKKGLKNCPRKKVLIIITIFKVQWAICEMCVLLSCALGLPNLFWSSKPKIQLFGTKCDPTLVLGSDEGQ